MARDLKYRGWSSSYDPYKYNNNRYRTSASTGSNLTSRGYPGSTGSYSGNTGYSLTSTRTGSGGGGSRSGGGGSSYNAGDAYSALLAAYRGNNYDDYLAQMRAAAQNAYDRGMSSLNSAYDSQMSMLAKNLASTKSQLLDQYNRSKKSINADSESSLKQAYINKMLSEKNLDQQMSAQGLTGGATETTRAAMSNNYGNARNNINTETNKNLSALEGNYNDNLAQAVQAYNTAVASAEAQRAQQIMALENALANNEIAALGDYQSLMQSQNGQYLDLLKSAIANGASFKFNPTEANNAVANISLQQANNEGYLNNTAWQNLMDAVAQGGNSTPTLSAAIANQTGNNYLAQILAQLRGY